MTAAGGATTGTRDVRVTLADATFFERAGLIEEAADVHVEVLR